MSVTSWTTADHAARTPVDRTALRSGCHREGSVRGRGPCSLFSGTGLGGRDRAEGGLARPEYAALVTASADARPATFDVDPPGEADLAPVRTGRARAWGTLRRNPVFWVGAALAGSMLLAGILAPLLAPYDPIVPYRDAIAANGDAAGPSERFLLGTDRHGRDFLSRLLFGARTSLVIALGANVIATTLGLAIGATAALAGAPSIPLGRGRRLPIPLESILMRLTDLWLSVPILLLTITLAFVIGASTGLVVVVIGMTLWTGTARIVYNRMRVLRTSEFVDASRALGSSTPATFRRHLLPHVLPILVVYASLGVAASVLFEATLSYLGAGVPPPTPTWGTILAEYASYFRTDPRLVVLPGLCVTITVLGFNLLGDALRDALDPRAWRT